jgi:hypothetical protein
MNPEMTPGLRLGLSVVAGVAGGIIANLIWNRPPIYLGLIVGAVIGAAAFLAWERYLAGGGTAGGEVVNRQHEYAAHQQAEAADPAAAPVDAVAGGQARWGDGSPAGRGRTVSGRRPSRPIEAGPSPDLARLVRPERLQAPVRLRQCPRCGSFEVDPAAASGVYTFACRACEHTWRWAPGEPWSRVVVDPRIRVPRYRDYPEGEEANHA